MDYEEEYIPDHLEEDPSDPDPEGPLRALMETWDEAWNLYRDLQEFFHEAGRDYCDKPFPQSGFWV